MAKKKVGRPKGPKTVRHNIVLPVETSKLLKKYAKIVKADVSEFVDNSVLLMVHALLIETKEVMAQEKIYPTYEGGPKHNNV